MKTNEAKQQWKPFSLTALVWLVVGSGLAFWMGSGEVSWITLLGWFLTFWLLSSLDLLAIAALVSAMGSWQDGVDRVRLGVRLAALAVLKMGLLGIFGAILFLNRGIPHSSLLVGLATLIVVPLFGGLAWSFGSEQRPKQG